jgi:imidazole glycerol-phosphate synthase subunit HisF
MYNKPRVIPVLLIDDRDLIKTVNFKERTYLGDPVNAVKIFNGKKVDELVILDIAASKKNREPDFELLKDIATEAFMPLSYGGGVTSVEQAIKLLAIGYEKIIFNTALVTNKNIIRELSRKVGSQSVVGSIDAIKIADYYFCKIKDGTELIKISPVELAKEAQTLGCGEILINSIDKDGTMSGYDLDLIQTVSSSVNIPTVACGGARNSLDLKKAIEIGNSHAVAAGSMFVFYGKLKAVLINLPSEKELKKTGFYFN